MSDLEPELIAELEKAWTGAAVVWPARAGMEPFASALARAEVLYQIVRVLYHETASGRPPGAPGEQHSIETVLDAALQHMLRTVRAMAEDTPTITPATNTAHPQGPF